MLTQKKFNLGRFKKSTHGIIEFAVLIEQADPQTREQIISRTQTQDPDFLKDVMRRVVFFEELVYLEQGVIAEILSGISPKVLAYALKDMPEDYRKAMLSNLSHRGIRLVKDEEDKFGTLSATSLIQGARKQVLKVARNLESQDKIVLELGDDCPRLNRAKVKKSG